MQESTLSLPEFVRTEPSVRFLSPAAYDEYLLQRGLYPLNPGKAIGITYINGSQEIVLSPDFYRRNGIPDELIEAIIEHERVELADGSPDAHYQALLAEYAFVVRHHGPEALQKYHDTLQKIYLGSDPQRQKAFQETLETQVLVLSEQQRKHHR